MQLSALLGAVLTLFVVISVFPDPGAAQTVPNSETSSALAVRAANESAWDRLVGQVFVAQQAFHRRLTEHLRDISQGGGGWATWSLVVASFLYGVFHATGPGHGKAVLSAYLLSHREAIRRGVGLALAASLCQGLVALAIVYGLVFVAGLVMNETQVAIRWSERASFALVMLLGAWLVWRGLSAIWNGTKHAHGCGHAGHDHHHHPDLGVPVAGKAGFWTTLGLILSIGMRPCSGAVIVLVFAQAAAIPWAGLAAVLVMSLGTGIAVAGLAFVAVSLRHAAARIDILESRGAVMLSAAAAIAGGAAIGALGLSLMLASLAPVHPMGL